MTSDEIVTRLNDEIVTRLNNAADKLVAYSGTFEGGALIIITLHNAADCINELTHQNVHFKGRIDDLRKELEQCKENYEKASKLVLDLVNFSIERIKRD